MLHGDSVEVTENESGAWLARGDGDDWRAVDRALQTIGKQRAALDAAESGWLCKAARLKIWREVGCVSLLDYLERRCSYAPRTAQDRVRVAFALEDLPGLMASLASGEQSFSSIKELVRVVTPEHEDEWLDKCQGKTVFEIQKMVAGRKKGSRPSDAPDPDLELRTLRFEDIKPTTVALLRQARAKAQNDCGEHLSDDALIAMMFGAFLDGPTQRVGGASEGSRRAKYQIAVTVCEKCQQGWQDGAGAKFAMAPAELARAECDAQRIGSLDTNVPTRASQDIPPSVRRFVWRRDGGKCSLKDCRSAACIEAHHLIALAAGGTHKPEQIILLCDAHHAALHRGLITITCTAPNNLVVTRLHDVVATADVAAPRELDAAVRSTAHVGAPGVLEVPVRSTAHVGAPGVLEVPVRSTAHVGAPGVLEVAARSNCHIMGVRGEARSSAHVGAPNEFEAVVWPSAHVGAASRLEATVLRTQAKDALVSLGWKPAIACAAVDEACTALTAPTVEQLIREALRRCPRPSARA